MTNEQWVAELYRAILNRPPEGEGATFWLNSLNAGLHTQPSAYQAILQTPEGQTEMKRRVRQAYRDALGREPENEEVVALWASKMLNGQIGIDQNDIFRAIRSTPEGDVYRFSSGTTEQATPTSQAGTTTEAGPRALSGEIQRILKMYDLEGLTSTVTKWIQDPKVTDDQIELLLYEEPAFKTRFPAIFERQAAGLPPINAQQYLQYEQTLDSLFRSANLPAEFYDNRSDFTRFISDNIDPISIQERIQEGYHRVLTAPTEVRARFAQMFGVEGDSALAAAFLDPDTAFPILERRLMAAEVAGTGDIMGIGIGQGSAEQLAAMGFDGRSSMQGFRQVQDQAALFNESITETQDLTAENEGVGAAFGTDPNAGRTLEQRALSRRGALSGGGGLMATETGLAGRAE